MLHPQAYQSDPSPSLPDLWPSYPLPHLLISSSTEVKAVTPKAIDCGGRVDTWQETVVQLWNSGGEEDRGFTTAGQFLAIYRRVAARVPVREEASLRFEYGDQVRPTIQYGGGSVDIRADQVLVHPGFPLVSCKPGAARPAAEKTTCCGPAVGTAQTVGGDQSRERTRAGQVNQRRVPQAGTLRETRARR
ncbi:DUF6428 family protein [Deinococcus sp. YIM 77859]|uniref:DUF6428 family protein n=1 Tax=Deinococcus sp. YIM 77859 TaxID=1540221 RepID=UPI00068B3B25